MPTVTAETLTQRFNELERRQKELENLDPVRDILLTSTNSSTGLYKTIPPFSDLSIHASSLHNQNLDEDERNSSMEDRQWQLRLSQAANNRQR